MKLNELKIGDTVFVARNGAGGGGGNYDAEITAVGRKWATIGRHGRFDRVTGALDGGQYSSPGDVYTNRAEWEAHVALHKAWSALQKDIWNHGLPTGATVEKIADARRLLGL